MTDADHAELGPIGDRVLYQDEQIWVWQMVLEPGERSPLHHHEHDYVVVVVAGDHIDVAPVGASKERADSGHLSRSITPGESVFLRKGATEVAINSGALRYRDVQIELLG